MDILPKTYRLELAPSFVVHRPRFHSRWGLVSRTPCGTNTAVSNGPAPPPCSHWELPGGTMCSIFVPAHSFKSDSPLNADLVVSVRFTYLVQTTGLKVKDYLLMRGAICMFCGFI